MFDIFPREFEIHLQSHYLSVIVHHGKRFLQLPVSFIGATTGHGVFKDAVYNATTTVFELETWMKLILLYFQTCTHPKALWETNA
jgi:hypothetical protein